MITHKKKMLGMLAVGSMTGNEETVVIISIVCNKWRGKLVAG